MQFNFEELKKYVIKRKEAFEIYSGLSDTPAELSPYRDIHLANNLRYLDDQSQELIAVLNNPRSKTEDKLLTAFVYTVLPDKYLLKRYCNERGVFTLSKLEDFANYLNNPRYLPNLRYRDGLFKNNVEMNMGDLLLAGAEAFLSTLPVDYFYKWSTHEIYRYYTTYKDSYGISKSIAKLLNHNLSYMNELEIEISNMFEAPSALPRAHIKEAFDLPPRYVLSGKGTRAIYDAFVDWYLTLNFKDNRERLIIPSDIPHLCKQYHMVLLCKDKAYKGWVVQRNAKFYKEKGGKKPLYDISNYVVPDSIYEYWKKRLHN